MKLSAGRKMKRGDTIIEVIFAITVFCLVSVLTITMMNHGLATGTASLELTLARQEMDAQAEAIRFIHDAYEAERNLPEANRIYTDLWLQIKDMTRNVVPPFKTDGTTCSTNSDDPHSLDFNHTQIGGVTVPQFVINARKIDPTNIDATIINSNNNLNRFTTTPLFPRLVYGRDDSSPIEEGTDSNQIVNENQTLAQASSNKVIRSEGVWVQAVQMANSPSVDFHIRACWSSPGRPVVSTLGTIVRIYDLNVVEEGQ